MNPAIISNTLHSMTRDQLRATARKLGVSVGHDKTDTVGNIANAISNNSARFTVQFTIRPNTDPAAKYAPAVFSKKLRTHKPDKVVVAP